MTELFKFWPCCGYVTTGGHNSSCTFYGLDEGVDDVIIGQWEKRQGPSSLSILARVQQKKLRDRTNVP